MLRLKQIPCLCAVIIVTGLFAQTALPAASGIEAGAEADEGDWARFIRIRRAAEYGEEIPPASSKQDSGSGQNHSPDTTSTPTPPASGSLSNDGAVAGNDSSGNDSPDARPPVQHDNARPEAMQPIVYTRVPRTHGKHMVTLRDGSHYELESPDIWDTLPDTRRVFDGFNAPGQLVYREVDGSERILYNCMQRRACVPLDPAVSLDGTKVLFSVYLGEGLKSARWSGTELPNRRLDNATGAQLHVVDIATGKITPLPHRKGTFDISPAWLPDGRIMFASDRQPQREPYLDRIVSNNRPDPQLYIADADGRNARNVTPHEVSSAMHPYVLDSGRVAYGSQWLSHNLPYIHTNGAINWPGTLDNMWVVMDMDYRGGDMTALLGAHRASLQSSTGRRKTMKALHFLGQRRNGDICVDNYYRGNNLGLGDVYCWTPEPVGVEGELPRFLPRKLYNVADWSKSNDEPSRKIDGVFQGKIGYPEGAPNNQLLLTVGRGYCTQVSGSVKSFQRAVADQPGKLACDVGLYLTTRIPSKSMDDLDRVVDRPEWHEFGARIVAPRQVDTPPLRDTSDGSCQLASSNAGVAETSPYKPYEFNDNYAVSANNGGEIDGLPHSQLAGIRFWEVLPNGEERDFTNITGNRMRLLGDVSLLADNSFKVTLPCDTPYLMAGIDSQGRVIKRDQVPQSLRPGEKRVCAGCHLHSRKGRRYEKTRAFATDAVRLLESSPVPTYRRDIQPIFERRCITCHVSDVPLMDYEALVWDQFQEELPPDWRHQVSNSSREKRRFGLQRPYTSKYINGMFARESLLYWKAANRRTDGRKDKTYPDDIDFGPDHPTDITDAELKVLADWIDSGATRLDRD